MVHSLLQMKQLFVAKKGVLWKFNLPAAPWWGGLFERMIKSVKRCLKKLLGRAHVDYEQLLTVLAEIQTVINNRPLTFLYDEPGDEVLTPNHLLYGRKINLENTSTDDNIEADEENITKKAKHIDTLLQHFRNRWRKEYLTELRENQKCKYKNNEHKLIEVGDIVLIHDEKVKRLLWNIAKVDELLKSRDNKIRGAKVTYYKNGKTTGCSDKGPTK